MAAFLGEVTLRNTYRVFEDVGAYVVEGTDKRGTAYRHTVPSQAVEFLRSAFQGAAVTSQEAATELEPVARGLGLPYHYGYKLNFYAQSVLLVLVARGDAATEKRGRAFHYTVW